MGVLVENELFGSVTSNIKNLDAVVTDRYAGALRTTGAILVGIVTGLLLWSSIQVGVGYALEGHKPTNWGVVQWGDHWMWRGVGSIAAILVSGFLSGMVARRHGARAAAIAVIPSLVFWLCMAWVGWTGHLPFTASSFDLPFGYRIIATVLVLGSVPCARFAGRHGAAYGRANAGHFDTRRWSFLGIRWYHFIWLPFLIHPMLITAAFGGVHGFQWFATSWKNGMSLLIMVPVFFYIAMFATLQLLGTGALKAYQALAGFEDDSNNPVWKDVVKYGIGYTLAAAVAQAIIIAVYYGLGILANKIFG